MIDEPLKKIYRLQENSYYSREDLSRLINCSLEDISAFIKYMKEKEVCNSDLKGQVSFRYVGMVEFPVVKSSEIERRIIFIEPKFIPADRRFIGMDGIDDVQKIVLRAILKYRKAQQVSHFSNGRIVSYEGCSTKLSTYLALIIDVIEKGAYQVPKVELVVNGQGDTDWNETFATVNPFFLDDRPCYVNMVNREIGYDDDTYISRLQMCLATKCFEYFEDIGIAEALGLFLDTSYDGELSDFGSLSYQKYRISNELRTQFEDDKKLTLMLMLAVVENKPYGSDNLDYQSFGISGFHALWEKAIKEVFCDELDMCPDQVFNEQEIDKLYELRSRDELFREKLKKPLKEFIDAPRWTKPNSTEEIVKELKRDKGGESDRLKPDFLAVLHKENRASTLVILDAKYYCPGFSGSSIEGVPGVGDINKQVLYQVAYADIIQTCGLNVHNAFIFPKWCENWNMVDEIDSNLFATVSVPSFGTIINKKIPKFNTYEIDGMALLKRYVYNKNDNNHNDLMKIFEGENLSS